MASNKVAVALSGGVDSAVAAWLLKSRGFQVFAFTLQLFPGDKSKALTDAAALISHTLGIQHNVLDISSSFNKTVITPFCRDYSRGLTPNPCVMCNLKIKFGFLLEHVQHTGFEFMATGHYVRRFSTSGGGFELHKALDASKDQSYFLYRLTHRKLDSLLFPLGGLTKARTRRLALEAGLPVSPDKESQDICFLPLGDYRQLVESQFPVLTGSFVDQQGKCVGPHQGFHHYTVGQRHGLKLGTHQKLYVLGMDSKSGNIVLGPESGLVRDELVAGHVSWISGKFPGSDTSISARIRSRAHEVPVQLSVSGNKVKVKFFQPVKSVSPGQSVVFYAGNRLLGGGIILA